MAITYRIEAPAFEAADPKQVAKLKERLMKSWENGDLVRYLRFLILERSREMKQLSDEIKDYEGMIKTLREIDPNNPGFKEEEIK